MNNSKPLLVLWSKAAADAASPRIDALQDKLVTEARDIISQTRVYFLHVFAFAGDTGCFIGTGRELPDTWKIFVQLGTHTSLQKLPDDHPDPELRGKVYTVPTAVDDPDNRLFAEFDDMNGPE